MFKLFIYPSSFIKLRSKHLFFKLFVSDIEIININKYLYLYFILLYLLFDINCKTYR